MAARTRKIRHDDETRAKIQASQLVNRLQSYALGKPDPQTKLNFDLSQGQLKAIEILLRKTLPDLSTTTLEGNPENPITVAGEIRLIGVRPGPLGGA